METLLAPLHIGSQGASSACAITQRPLAAVKAFCLKTRRPQTSTTTPLTPLTTRRSATSMGRAIAAQLMAIEISGVFTMTGLARPLAAATCLNLKLPVTT